MGVGEWTTVEKVKFADIAGFLPKLDQYRQNLESYAGKIDGTAAAIEAIERNLPLKNTCPQETAASLPKNRLYDALSPASS
jgi:hypothetical protein